MVCTRRDTPLDRVRRLSRRRAEKRAAHRERKAGAVQIERGAPVNGAAMIAAAPATESIRPMLLAIRSRAIS